MFAMTTPLNAAVNGCGVIAPTHVESYQQAEHVTVRWACDLVGEKAAKLAEKYKIERTTTDYREVLKDPKVTCVSVCTDHGSHSKIVVDALTAGKHVICEKALAATTEQLDDMFKAHARTPGLLFAGIFQNRHNKTHQIMKRLVDERALGTMLAGNLQVYCLRTDEYYMADKWRGTWEQEGGSLMINQAIHFVDLFNWIMGGAVSVSGHYANLTHGESIETEDTATASLQFKNGALGVISASSSTKQLEWDSTISLVGAEGVLEMRGGKILRINLSNKEMEKKIIEEIEQAQEAPKNVTGKSYYGSNHISQIQDFIDAIRERREPFITAASARHAVEIVLAIYKSHQSGRCVQLAKPPAGKK